MYYNWKEEIRKEELIEVCNFIKNGELVVFPTETVYGIGANALDEKAVQKIFEAKGRPSDNPLIVHITNQQEIDEIAIVRTEMEQKLIERFMPGPFTLILPKKDVIPDIVSGGLDTVAIRMPEHKIAQQIIHFSGVPIAAPSANLSGKPSGTKIEDIRKELEGKVAGIVDGGKTPIGLESTVVKVMDETAYILRPGKITLEEIKETVGSVQLANGIFHPLEEKEKAESPGMKHKHYAPATPAKLFYAEEEKKLISAINKTIKNSHGKVIVLGFEEHKKQINVPEEQFISLGSKNSLEEMAQNIFSALRRADTLGGDLILIEGVKKEGIGMAIMNRLLRSCSYQYLEF